jgi:hypothetical protein
MSISSEARPPFPPFTRETALQKVRMAEDAWNNRDPQRVALAYTIGSTASGGTVPNFPLAGSKL